MNDMTKITVLVLVVILIISLTMSVQFISEIKQISDDGSVWLNEDSIPDHHFVVITDNLDSYARNIFHEGIEEAAELQNAVIETYEVETDLKADALEKAFELAWLIKADGIIVNLSDNNAAEKWITATYEKNIPIIVSGNDAYNSNKDAYVGTNKYTLGETFAGLVESASEGQGEAAIILSKEYGDSQNSIANNFITGFNEYIENVVDVTLNSVSYSSEERAELIVYNLIDANPALDTIVCTDPNDGIKAAKVVIDLNLVGDIKIVTSSDLPEIIDYIHKGIVDSSIVENHGLIGYQSVMSLSNLLDGKRISSYISIPIDIIDASTLSAADSSKDRANNTN